MNVNNVYLTGEIAKALDMNAAYILRVAKDLLAAGIITSTEMRAAGSRNYIFSQSAYDKICNKVGK